MSKSHLALLAALAVCTGGWWFSDRIDPYLLDVITSIGINIILAVSLNLVNGYTGQFSLGHAGFMAIGAYLSGACTIFLGPRVLGPDGGNCWTQGMFFLGALIAGGLSASVAGLLIGVPSLRLKGDYLALVTLGFGEIIRVIFQNTDCAGRRARPQPHPCLHKHPLDLWFCGAGRVRRGMPHPFDLWPRISRHPGRRDRGRVHRPRHDALQDRGVCDGGLFRGRRRRALRPLQAINLSDGLRFHEVHRRLSSWSFSAVWATRSGSSLRRWIWLAIVGAINSVISLYYYARVFRYMFLRDTEDQSGSLHINRMEALILITLAIPTLIFGLYFTSIVDLANISVQMFGLH